MATDTVEADMSTTPHIKAGSGAECSEVRTRDTVEAIVADMRGWVVDDEEGNRIADWADRLQSAHDAETKDLRAELEDARKLLAATSEERDHANRAAESAESRLREAERAAAHWLAWCDEAEKHGSDLAPLLDDAKYMGAGVFELHLRPMLAGDGNG